mmetsp:Transcript_36809/g.90892  ORF Transcript_36809/g.90892 Transcript_36809/m.90892 type:complete len:380 (+) Transcript_36809:494-1633(+)
MVRARVLRGPVLLDRPGAQLRHRVLGGWGRRRLSLRHGPAPDPGKLLQDVVHRRLLRHPAGGVHRAGPAGVDELQLAVDPVPGPVPPRGVQGAVARREAPAGRAAAAALPQAAAHRKGRAHLRAVPGDAAAVPQHGDHDEAAGHPHDALALDGVPVRQRVQLRARGPRREGDAALGAVRSGPVLGGADPDHRGVRQCGAPDGVRAPHRVHGDAAGRVHVLIHHLAGVVLHVRRQRGGPRGGADGVGAQDDRGEAHAPAAGATREELLPQPGHQRQDHQPRRADGPARGDPRRRELLHLRALHRGGHLRRRAPGGDRHRGGVPQHEPRGVHARYAAGHAQRVCGPHRHHHRGPRQRGPHGRPDDRGRRHPGDSHGARGAG